MALAFLVPGRLDQLTGGYLYDRHVVDGLRARGRPVRVIALPGRYPDADEATREAAAALLASLPDGTTAIIDGLALPGFADVLKMQARRLRLVGFIHHPLALETGLSSDDAARFAQLEGELWPHLRGAICPSPHTARAVAAAGLPADRVAVVAPGVHRPAALRPKSDTRPPLQLLSVGTITPRKGHLLLIEALARLPGDSPGDCHDAARGAPRPPDWRLTCIGSVTRDPAATAALQERIAFHRLGDRVRLLGEQAAERLSQAYRDADLFVLPSHHEGYGMVFAEALAHGLPVIATTAGAIPDTVPADASLLVPPGDMAALTGALLRALTDDVLRARLSESAFRAAGVLPGWDQAVSDWIAALDKVSR